MRKSQAPWISGSPPRGAGGALGRGGRGQQRDDDHRHRGGSPTTGSVDVASSNYPPESSDLPRETRHPTTFSRRGSDPERAPRRRPRPPAPLATRWDGPAPVVPAEGQTGVPCRPGNPRSRPNAPHAFPRAPSPLKTGRDPRYGPVDAPAMRGGRPRTGPGAVPFEDGPALGATTSGGGDDDATGRASSAHESAPGAGHAGRRSRGRPRFDGRRRPDHRHGGRGGVGSRHDRRAAGGGTGGGRSRSPKAPSCARSWPT